MITMDVWDDALATAQMNDVAEAGRLALNRMQPAKFIVAVGASGHNKEVQEFLRTLIPVEGRARGRSNQQDVEDEDADAEVGAEEVLDTELEYMRPNGLTYYARNWSGIKDVEVLRRARVNKHAPLLKGLPGTGKTALVDATFPDLITIVVSGDTEVRDLVGDYAPNPQFGMEGQPEYVWVDGPLIRAMVEGRPLLIDEIGLLDPKVGSILYGVMDGRNELVVSMNQSRGIVKAEEGFFIIGATNPNAPGVQMSEALLSRFTLQVEVTTDWALAMKLGVPRKMVLCAEALSAQVADGNTTWAPQFRELEAYKSVSEIYGASFALANLMALCPPEDFNVVREIVGRTFSGGVVYPATI